MSATLSASSDRRRSPREGHIIEGWISSLSSANTREVTAVDISRHGVSFEAEFPLTLKSKHVFQIGFGEQRLVCKMRIANCRPIGTGIWLVGAEFI